MVFSNHASNQANNRNDNNSNQNNKAHKEAMSLRWTSTIQYPSDDKNQPRRSGVGFYPICCSTGIPAFNSLKSAARHFPGEKLTSPVSVEW